MIGKRYLGDGVYVTVDDRGLVLTAENGIRATDTIVLEAEVLDAFLVYLTDTRQALITQKQAEREAVKL